MDEKQKTDIPNFYGTGRAPVERPLWPIVVVLVGILVGANLIAAGFLFESRQEAKSSPSEMESTEPNSVDQTEEEAQRAKIMLEDIKVSLVEIVARREDKTASSTGVILSSNGYILTSADLVQGADDLTVTLHDESNFTADIVGMDSGSDMAVVKIGTSGLVPIDYAQSDGLIHGDPATLVTSAFGRANVREIIVQETVRVIGGVERRIFNVGCGMGEILINEYGDPVAIGTAQGDAFPIGTAVALTGELILYGRLNDPSSLGMEIGNLDDAQISFWDLPGGVIITWVTPNGSAKRVGLQAGDVLLSLDGNAVWDVGSYWEVLQNCRERDSVEVEIYRAGEYLTMELYLKQG